MQWFECWFNSPYYHLLYGKRNEEEAAFFLERLLGKLALPAGAHCWDLNCGKGRHAVFLNKKGFDVTATDLSTESIQCAKRMENDHLHFFTHDMRGLFYANYFDAVFNLFTSFGYFKHAYEDEKVFRSVAHALKPGGVFILDFFNAKSVLQKLVAQDEKNIQGVRFRIHKKTEKGFIVKEIEVNDGGKVMQFKEEVHALTREEFKELGKKAGLELIEAYGNYSLDAYDAENSERLILIFKK